MKTKQNIFSLYVGKCEVRTSNGKPDMPFTGYVKSYANNDYDVVYLAHKAMGTEWDYVINSTLILRSPTEISGEEEQEYLELRATCENCKLNGVESFNSMLWLIDNGFALFESWFQGDIAIRKEVK